MRSSQAGIIYSLRFLLASQASQWHHFRDIASHLIAVTLPAAPLPLHRQPPQCHDIAKCQAPPAAQHPRPSKNNHHFQNSTASPPATRQHQTASPPKLITSKILTAAPATRKPPPQKQHHLQNSTATPANDTRHHQNSITGEQYFSICLLEPANKHQHHTAAPSPSLLCLPYRCHNVQPTKRHHLIAQDAASPPKLNVAASQATHRTRYFWYPISGPSATNRQTNS